MPPKEIFGARTNIAAEPFVVIGDSHSCFLATAARPPQPIQSSSVFWPWSSSELELDTAASSSGYCSSYRWTGSVQPLVDTFGSTFQAFSFTGPEFDVNIAEAPSNWPMIRRQLDYHAALFRNM